MKAYLDANIYVCYLLGERGEEEVDRALSIATECKFSIVASQAVFGEVQYCCGNEAVPLLQITMEKLSKPGKIAIEKTTEAEVSEASSLNEKTGERFGQNDFLHAIMAARHADCFVTADRKFAPEASKIVKTLTLDEFLKSLEF